MTVPEAPRISDRIRDAINDLPLDDLPRPDLGRVRAAVDDLPKPDLDRVRAGIAGLDLPGRVPGPWRDELRRERRRRRFAAVAVVGAVGVGIAALVLVRPLRDWLASIAGSIANALGLSREMAADDEAWPSGDDVILPTPAEDRAPMPDLPADRLDGRPSTDSVAVGPGRAGNGPAASQPGHESGSDDASMTSREEVLR